MTIYPTPEQVLEALLSAPHGRTKDAPNDSRGIYGLVDHFGNLCYIGSNGSAAENLRKRIHARHRTGSETYSHYFSKMYNTGRMWCDRDDKATKADGAIAKRLRSEFIAEYCRAVWVPLPDDADIAGIEAAIINMAPKEVVAWNRRGMDVYEEPRDLVDALLTSLKWSDADLEAIERQERRFLGQRVAPKQVPIPDFPKGPFDFFALDVETANNDRASICQIGVAAVRPDRSIETWVTYVDPQVDRWTTTFVHGITEATVGGAPLFSDVLPVLENELDGAIVYQHSGFDRSAMGAACRAANLEMPTWEWRDSVLVARQAWPELKRKGGHGLASLKDNLGLNFKHHDAGEDARASAEIVLLAESGFTPAEQQDATSDDFNLIEDDCNVSVDTVPTTSSLSVIGETVLSGGNIRNHHFYLREFLDKFPADCIGGSNRAASADKMVTIDWGGTSVEQTDIDGTKKFFRNRSWIRSFFELHSATEGDVVVVVGTAPYVYRVSLRKRA